MAEMFKMFFTQPTAEFRPPVPFDLKIKRWAFVEYELDCAWFHLALTIHEGGHEITRTVLIANLEQLRGFLDIVPSCTQVSALMMMTPPKMNGTHRWRLEHVLTIDVAAGADATTGRYVVTTEIEKYELIAPAKNFRGRLYGATEIQR